MTRASFSLEDEKNSMPSFPASVHAQKKEETKRSTSMDDESYEKVDDVESGRDILLSWQQNEEVNRKKGGGNETMRAQYEIHPRK